MQCLINNTFKKKLLDCFVYLRYACNLLQITLNIGVVIVIALVSPHAITGYSCNQNLKHPGIQS